MKPRRYTAMRFVHPDLDVTETQYTGVQVNHRGGIDSVSEHASVRQAILLLLSTTPGERVMRPHYGCDLRSLVFAPNTDTTAGLAIHYVRQAIRRWEPRIEVLRLRAGRYPSQPEHLIIQLDYRVRLTGQQDYLEYALSLSGGRS